MPETSHYDAHLSLERVFSQEKWVFAKTMPEHPHYYTLRKSWQNDDDFISAVMMIRKYGYKEKFKNRDYVMLNINEDKYWTMGAPIKDTILINKTAIHPTSVYDTIASQYDAHFDNLKYHAEEEELFSRIPNSQSVLDIGCGTGLYLKYKHPANYVGIDPSHGMLSILKQKYPDVQTCQTKFEDFYYNGRFDLIVSLFGSASYVAPSSLNEKIQHLLKNDGKFFLMFYKPDYLPETHKFIKEIVLTYADGNSFDYGQKIEFTNYIIRTNL